MRKMFLVGAILSLSGCSVISGDPVDQMVPFDGGGTRTFTFKKAYPEQKIDTSAIVDSMITAMERASVLRPYYIKRSSSSTSIRGVKISNNKAGMFFLVTHHNEYFLGEDTSPLLDNRSGKYSYKIKESADRYTLTMTCPNEFYDKASLRGGIIDNPFFTEEQTINNFKKICSGTESPTIHIDLDIKGEYNSKYSPKDISANFDRLLHKDIPAKHRVKFKTLPYRGGTKVIYNFKYPYKITPLINSYSKDDIELVHNKIKSIIND